MPIYEGNKWRPSRPKHAEAGVAGFSGPFDVRKVGEIYWMASQFEPSYRGLAEQLQPRAPVYLALCGN